jgi:hypothetical protein
MTGVMAHTQAPCIVCGKALENLDPTGNQPIEGLAFWTSGHWPSTVLDGAAGITIEINFFEPCLKKAAEAGRVLQAVKADRTVRSRPVYSLWAFPERKS